jgi:regulator of protease activity HflC (stomatin/prohibitin superfamily)
LNINGQAQVQQQIHEPLDPANIPLPPSVASALQSINEKVTARQNKQKALAEAAAARQAAILAAKQESQITVQTSPSTSPSSSPNSSSGPVFYYLMPGSVPYSLSSDGGATVQVKTADGQVRKTFHFLTKKL